MQYPLQRTFIGVSAIFCNSEWIPSTNNPAPKSHHLFCLITVRGTLFSPSSSFHFGLLCSQIYFLQCFITCTLLSIKLQKTNSLVIWQPFKVLRHSPCPSNSSPFYQLTMLSSFHHSCDLTGHSPMDGLLFVNFPWTLNKLLLWMGQMKRANSGHYYFLNGLFYCAL